MTYGSSRIVHQARPFLRWAGGKTQLLPELRKHIPSNYGTYHEPFLGGGALFFALKPKNAVLSDVNLHLVHAYLTIRDYVDPLIELLKDYQTLYRRGPEQLFYRVRGADPGKMTEIQSAARMIFLNKTCFQGLYRVNKKGQFNTPFGKRANPTICDEENLRACSAALQGAVIRRQGFKNAFADVNEGDLVYADSPYVPLKADSFSAYTADGFGPQDQKDLRDAAVAARARGAHVVLSNSGSPVVAELYKDFTLHPVQARRNVNSKGTGRGPVGEYIIT